MTKCVAKDSSWIQKPAIRLGSETVRDAYRVGTGWRRNPRGRDGVRDGTMARGLRHRLSAVPGGAATGSTSVTRMPARCAAMHCRRYRPIKVRDKTHLLQAWPSFHRRISANALRSKAVRATYDFARRSTAPCNEAELGRQLATWKPCRAFRIGGRPMPGRSEATHCHAGDR